jgi:hypothetical protein
MRKSPARDSYRALSSTALSIGETRQCTAEPYFPPYATECVAIAYRLLFAYPFVRPESEQNSSHLQIDCARVVGNRDSMFRHSVIHDLSKGTFLCCDTGFRILLKEVLQGCPWCARRLKEVLQGCPWCARRLLR